MPVNYFVWVELQRDTDGDGNGPVIFMQESKITADADHPTELPHQIDLLRENLEAVGKQIMDDAIKRGLYAKT